MKGFKAYNYEEFKKYAMRDAVIPLHHALHIMEIALDTTKKYFLPITLSSLAQELLAKSLGPNFQLPTKNYKYSTRNMAKLFTPKGIELNGGLADYLPYYMASLRGGRNECFVYGRISGPLYDYDLPGAYATALSLLALPDYKLIEIINPQSKENFLFHYKHRLIHSYTSLKIEFRFPSNVKYPNLAVRLDDTSIIFPLEGETYCTGVELELAITLKCDFKILGGWFIPFKSESKATVEEVDSVYIKYLQDDSISDILKEYNTILLNYSTGDNLIGSQSQTRQEEESAFDDGVPFKDTDFNTVSMDEDIKPEFSNEHGFEKTGFFILMNKLISERQKHPKGSLQNLFYKFLSNSGIGQMSRGVGQKTSYDHVTNTSQVIPGGDLTNPIVAG